jgi:hypothetical protein
MEIANDHLHVDHALAVDLRDHAEHAVRARVLRPDVDFDRL